MNTKTRTILTAMDSRLRHAAGIVALSLLMVGTATAQSNLGWTWNKTLILPSERGQGAYTSSPSRERLVHFSPSSSVSHYGTWSAGSSISRGSTYQGAAANDESRPVTWADLRRYHEEVVRPLQQAIHQKGIPSALPSTGEPPGNYKPPAAMQQSKEGMCEAAEEGRIRDAADECNVCMCRGGSWLCTHYACTGENERRACAADSDCAVNERCSTSDGDCNRDCRRGMQACGPGICGGICKPAGDAASKCGDDICDRGEASFCASDSPLCLQGTCPSDCATQNVRGPNNTSAQVWSSKQ